MERNDYVHNILTPGVKIDQIRNTLASMATNIDVKPVIGIDSFNEKRQKVFSRNPSK
jgi:hypothetical protein